MGRPELWRDLEAIYADLDRELSGLRPVCWASGRCCRFKEFGHQLWTTGVELDYLLERQGPPPPASAQDGTCPYLRQGFCSVRDSRMLGCRIFFCDTSYAPLMGPLYEKYHARIKDLHQRHGEPYRYGELLALLKERRERPAATPT